MATNSSKLESFTGRRKTSLWIFWMSKSVTDNTAAKPSRFLTTKDALSIWWNQSWTAPKGLPWTGPLTAHIKPLETRPGVWEVWILRMSAQSFQKQTSRRHLFHSYSSRSKRCMQISEVNRSGRAFFEERFNLTAFEGPGLLKHKRIIHNLLCNVELKLYFIGSRQL